MQKKDFLRLVAINTGFSQKDIDEVLDGVQDVVYKALADGDEIPLMKGLKLTRVTKAARKGRNPQTGESIMIPEKFAPKAKFSAVFKDALN